MDIEVRPTGADIWSLVDVPGRAVGTVVQAGTAFLIEHDRRSVLNGVRRGPYLTLDDALSAVERQVLGRCRRTEPPDQP